MYHEQDNSKFYILALLFAVLVVMFGYIAFSPNNNNDVDNKNISVNGYAESKVLPNEAYVYFNIETKEDSMELAKSENNKLYDSLKENLENKGYVKLNTEQYNSYPEQVWDNNQMLMVETGKQIVSHRLKATITDLDNVGTFLDLLTENKINKVDSVNFGLSKDKETELKAELWKDAVNDASTKANSVASALNVKLNKSPKSVTLNDYSYPIYYNSREYATSSEAGYDMKTNIAPKETTISVSLTITYEYE